LLNQHFRSVNRFPRRYVAPQHGRGILTAGRAFDLCAWHTDDDDQIGTESPEEAMSNMKDRQEGFEKKFALDQDLQFRATARRNKLLGLWVAEKLGKTGADADAYAKEVVKSDFEEAGDDDVFRKVRKDFDAAGVEQSDHQIRRTMEELLAEAIEQVRNS
jgi:hypothetical protein